MHTVEDVLDRLQRPPIQPAPCWRVRIAFVDGIVLEETFEPDADWPLPLTQHPPARFIARQSMNVLRPYLGKGTRDPVRLEIEPPPGTIDDRGRTVRTLIASVRIRRG